MSLCRACAPPYCALSQSSLWHGTAAKLSSPITAGFLSYPLFVSLRLSLAQKQCPFPGTKCWKETEPRPSQWSSFSVDHHGPLPVCHGYICLFVLQMLSVWGGFMNAHILIVGSCNKSLATCSIFLKPTSIWVFQIVKVWDTLTAPPARLSCSLELIK